MPFAPRSFGAGRRPLVKPSPAAMQQLRRGSPSVAPVPLRMPARPPVANRMQPPIQQQPQPGGNFGMPGGLDPRAIAADPAGFARWQQGAQAQESKFPGSTMLGQSRAPVRQQPTQDSSGGGSAGIEMGMPPGTYDNMGGGGVGMNVPQNPNDGMSLGSDWANPTPMPKPVMTEAPVRQVESYPMMNDPSTGRPYGQSGPYDPTPMPKPVMTEAPAQNVPSGLDSFLKYRNAQPGGGGGEMSQPGYGYSGGGFYGAQGAQGGFAQPGGGGVGMSMPHNPNEIGMRTQDYKRGGQVQAYAKGGRVMAKPVAKKAVKAATPAKTASRGDGIAQRGRTKGTMR